MSQYSSSAPGRSPDPAALTATDDSLSTGLTPWSARPATGTRTNPGRLSATAKSNWITTGLLDSWGVPLVTGDKYYGAGRRNLAPRGRATRPIATVGAPRARWPWARGAIDRPVDALRLPPVGALRDPRLGYATPSG